MTPSLRGGGADAVAATTTTVEDGNRKLACSITKPSDCVPKVPKIPTPKIPGVDTGKCKVRKVLGWRTINPALVCVFSTHLPPPPPISHGQ